MDHIIKGTKETIVKKLETLLKASYMDCDGVLSVTVSNHRSISQNNLLHERIRQIADDTGEVDLDYLKKSLKLRLGYYTIDEDGNKVPDSTGNMNSKRLGEFITRIEIFMQQELGFQQFGKNK